MILRERYSVGTKIGALEGRVLSTYMGACLACEQTTRFTTRAVADADHDAEIEVCEVCLTVKKFAGLN